MDDRALCFFPLHLPMSPQSASAYNWTLESARYPLITYLIVVILIR